VPSVFDTAPHTFNLAHECAYCNILVCEKCRDDAIAVQEEREKRQAEAEERDEEQGRADQDLIVDEGVEDIQDEVMATPSLFD